jgi:hypothetical protein
MRIGRSIHPLYRTLCYFGPSVHTALTLYLYFIATALPPASYDAAAEAEGITDILLLVTKVANS